MEASIFRRHSSGMIGQFGAVNTIVSIFQKEQTRSKKGAKGECLRSFYGPGSGRDRKKKNVRQGS